MGGRIGRGTRQLECDKGQRITGRLYRIWEQPQDWDINESVFSIRTATEVVSTDYLYATMNSDYFRATSFTLRTGSVQKGIRIGDLKSIKIVVPPDALMDLFSSKVQPLYQKMWKVEKENIELIALRDFLLPLLMNGQVLVAPAEAAVEATAEE